MKLQRRLAFILVLLFFTTTSTAFAYSYSGYRWSGTSVTYYINTGISGLWGSQIRSADATWDSAGSRFRFNYGGTTGRNASLIYGTADGYSDVGYKPLGRTGVIGQTSVQTSGSYITEVDAVFNTDYAFSTTGDGCCYDAQNTMTHEFGHWLWLNHSTSSCGWSWEATMCSNASTGETRKRSLESDDKNAIKAIYGI